MYPTGHPQQHLAHYRHMFEVVRVNGDLRVASHRGNAFTSALSFSSIVAITPSEPGVEFKDCSAPFDWYVPPGTAGLMAREFTAKHLTRQGIKHHFRFIASALSRNNEF